MADRISKEARSWIMSRIRSSGTGPERTVTGWLEAAGLSGAFVVNDRSLPGSPDFHFPALRHVLFVDGGFWHGHSSCFSFGKSGKYWDDKIAKNMERDRVVDAALAVLGYSVMRVWDFEVTGNDSGKARERVVTFAKGEGQ